MSERDGISEIFDLDVNDGAIRVTNRNPQYAHNSGLTPPAFQPTERAYDSDEPWQNKIEDADIIRLLKGEGLAGAISDVWSRAVGGKPPAVYDDVGGRLAEEIEALLTRLNFWTKLQEAYKQKRDRGLCLISLGWADGAEGEGLAEPVADRVSDIEFIHVIQRNMVKKIHQGTNPLAEDYGQITGYDVEFPEGDNLTPTTFTHHASRYLHWAHPSPDGSPFGMSQFIPMWNTLRGMYRMDNALYTTVRRCASKIPFYTYPKGTSTTRLDTVETNLKTLDHNSVVGFGEGWTLDLLGTADVMDPQPIIDYTILKLGAMGPGNKVVLVGPEEGKLASAETSERTFYTRAKDEQTNVYGAKAREFIDVCRLRGVIRSPGNYWLDFPPIREDDSRTKAETDEIAARALKTRIEAITAATGKQFTAVTDPDGQVKLVLDGGGVELEIVGVNSAEATDTNARYSELPKVEEDKLINKWLFNTAKNEAELLETFNKHYSQLQRDIFEFMGENWDETGLPREKTSTNDLAVFYAQNDEAAFFMRWAKWQIKTAALEREVAVGVGSAFRAGMHDTESRMGWELSTMPLNDIEAARAMEWEGRAIAQDTLLQGKAAARVAIENGFKQGRSYGQMTDDVAKALGDKAAKFPATVQKIAHTAQARARWDTMQRHGVQRVKYWTANDDRVRDTHRAWHGLTAEYEDVMHLLSEYGCRCTISPESEYDKSVQYLKDQEAGVI